MKKNSQRRAGTGRPSCAPAPIDVRVGEDRPLLLELMIATSGTAHTVRLSQNRSHPNGASRKPPSVLSLMHSRSRDDRLSFARTVALLALAASTLSGCYRYRPTETLRVQSGEQIRLQMTRAGAEAVAARLGPETAVVEGRVRADGASGIQMTVLQTTRWGDGGLIRWTGELVTIPHDAIARTELRTLDRGRSVMAGGVAVLATIGTFLILRATTGGGSGDTPGVPSPTP